VDLPRNFEAPIDGRFVVEHPVGEGATGVVFRAFDLEKKRAVALKIFHRETLAPDERAENDNNLAESEAELLATISHPGVIEVVDSGYLVDLRREYLALEWLDGHELSRHHNAAPFGAREVIALGVLLCRALSAVHASNIVHQDIKPGNIMLRRRPPVDDLLPELEVEPVLIDFGLAAQSPQSGIAGTPAYMSPEQAQGETAVDWRSDLYSLGATLFELLVGRPPHQGASPLATLARLATTSAPRVSSFRTDLPRQLDDVVDALLQTEPAHRPQTAREAEELLLECLSDEVPESFPSAEASSRLGTGTTRLVTTIVGMKLNQPGAQDEALERLRSRGAQAVPLGKDAVVGHFGVQKVTGGEARAGIQLGLGLAKKGASVGIASGRARLQGQSHARVRPVGDVVDRAATLAREATSEQVISDATTSELGRGRFEFRMRGDGSAIIGEALRTSGDRSGGAPFVGRDAELAQILGAYERACEDRHSIVVSVTGPPGIGKSRLQREFVGRVSSQAEPPRIVVQRSDAYGRSHVLGAAADILRSLVDLPKAATPGEVEAAIVERLGPETMSTLTSENRLLLGRLLGGNERPDEVAHEGSRDALWLAMTDLVTRVLSNEPVVLVAEDLQWADSESVAWIDHLLGRSSRNPLFVLACVRPTFWQDDEQRYSQRDHLRIDLRPISPQAVRVIAEAVLGERATSEAVDGISFQASGSPLFAEELARLAAAGKSATQTPTIEAAIQASLDSLDPDYRAAVERLSVLGQSCWSEALTALGQPVTDEILTTLVAREILLEQSSSRFPDTKEYIFKHALVRDVAYQSLLPAPRKELHALAGRWLAKMGEDAATVAGQLDLGADHELAASFWERATKRALTANALTDAVTMAERALDFATSKQDSFKRASYLDEAHSRLDPRAADRETAISAMESSAFDEASQLRAEGARARYDDARGTGHDVSRRLAKIRDAARAINRKEEEARCSASLASRSAYAGDFDTAEEEVKRLLELATHVPGAAVDAYQTLAIIRQAKGAVSASLDARKSAAQAARGAGLTEREAMLTTNLGFALSTVGARKEARDALERGLMLAENIGSPAATRHAQMNLLGWAGHYGSDRRLDTFLSETRAEADASATGYWASPDRSNLGMLFYRGVELLRSSSESHRRRALALLRLSAESYREMGHRDVLPGALGMWAEAERLLGGLGEAARIGEEACNLLLEGAPSLLNESPVFLTLYKARLALGEEDAAKDALASSIRPLLRRLNGLVGSPYAGTFLTQLPQNSELVSAIDAAGLLPESVHRILAQASDL